MAKIDRRNSRRPLRRRTGTRQPKKTIVAFCEGKETEPQYLEALKRQPEVRDVAAVDIRIRVGQGGGPVPEKLLSMAIDARDRAADEEAEIDEFWCVFDVEWPENHKGLKEAVQQAAENEISLAITNPCFELWLILHFQAHGAWLDNEGARRLRRQLDGSTGKSLDGNKYMPNIRSAVSRAVALERRHHRDGNQLPDDNPSSGMHRLIASIRPQQELRRHVRARE